jgi:hypothetical protein
MASRGFEFAYMLDGSNATPVIRDFLLGETTAYKVGDLVLMQSDGYVDKVTTATTEVTGVMMEAITPATAGAFSGKVAILTRNQVWRVSMNASTTSFVVGYTKTIDTVDANTASATDSTGGGMILVDASLTDDDGNVMAYVNFADTTFGNT